MKSSVAAICLAFATCASAATTMSKADYQAAKKAVAADASTAKAKCKDFVANAKDVCMAEARGKEKVALAQLEETYQPSDKTRYNTLVAQAKANHAVDKEKCDHATGNAKDVCVKQADAAQANALADAKAKRKIVAARKDVATEKRDGQYAIAKEKCDAQTGDKKDACLKDAKANFGKI